MKDELSLNDVNQILNQTKRQKKSEVRWPDQFKDEIQLAIMHDADEVNLGGKMFEIRYDGQMFYLKPVHGLVPSGWFHRSWVSV